MTPARLLLMTAVGPPDCATKRFPTSSAIILRYLLTQIDSAKQSLKPLQKLEPYHANASAICQRPNPERARPGIPYFKFVSRGGFRYSDFAMQATDTAFIHRNMKLLFCFILAATML